MYIFIDARTIWHKERAKRKEKKSTTALWLITQTINYFSVTEEKKKHEISSIFGNKWANQLLNGNRENKLGQRSVLVLKLVEKLGETWTLSIQSHSTSHSRSYFVTISSIWCHRQSTPASIILLLASIQHSNAYSTVLFVTIEIR